MFYKENALCPDWRGFNDSTYEGILFYFIFSHYYRY